MTSHGWLRVPLQVLRSVDLRCPHCRRGRVFRNPWLARERCPTCGLVFLRDEGDFWGGVVFNYTYAGIVGMAVAALLVKLGVQDWEWIAYGAAAAVVLSVLTLFPFAKAQWIALLYATRGHYEEYRPPDRGAEERP